MVYAEAGFCQRRVANACEHALLLRHRVEPPDKYASEGKGTRKQPHDGHSMLTRCSGSLWWESASVPKDASQGRKRGGARVNLVGVVPCCVK